MSNLKHTPQYAKKLADKIYTPESITNNAFQNGYLAAIEKTNAPELLEALIAVRGYIADRFGIIDGDPAIMKMSEVIKKATM